MNDFDYVCLFLAIPFGLALTEIAQGISLALRRRNELAIGWLTPLTVLLMLLIVSMVLETFWNIRETVPVSMPVIFIGFLFAMLFYVTASFVFPERLDSKISLDDWFMENRKFSLGGTTVLGLGFFLYFLMGNSRTVTDNTAIFLAVSLVMILVFGTPVIYTIFASTKRRALIGIMAANVLYLLLITSFVVTS